MAEYQGSIELISGLIPKNNQDFPLVSAHHVQVDNTGKRLDLVLQSIDASVLDRIEAILPDLQNAANFETYNTLNTNVLSIRDNLVLAQETQPESEDNRIWIKPTNDEYLVPSYEELQDVKKGVSNLLNEITDVKEINNLLVPMLNTNVDTSSSEVHQHDNHYSAAVTLQANHTYMAYGSVTISNLTGYTAGAIALKMFGSDSYNFVCTTKKITTVKNGVHEVYGTFTPSTSGVVYATLENTNHPTGTAYTYTANFNKLYLFDLTETEATQAECLAVVQKYNYSGILYTTPGSYHNLAEEVTDLKSAVRQSETHLIAIESGTFSDSNGAVKTPNVKRLRNVAQISVYDLYSITLPDGYSGWFFRLNKNGEHISAYNGWQSGTVLMTTVTTADTAFINIGIRKTAAPNDDISADALTVEAGISVAYKSALELEAFKEKTDNDILSCEEAVSSLNGIVKTLNYSTDCVLGSGYYVDNGVLKTATYSSRFRTINGIRLNHGDIIGIEQGHDAVVFVCYKPDNDNVFSSVSYSSPYIVPTDGMYYLTLKYNDNRTLTDATAAELLSYFSLLRGTGNPAIINGESWAVSNAVDGKTNFFSQNRLLNAYIDGSNAVKISDAHRAVWMKLAPNTAYNIQMAKAANVTAQIALLNGEPYAGLVCTWLVSDYYKTSLEATIKTSDEYSYLFIKYAQSNTENQQEILDSIRVTISVGEADRAVIKNTQNARHIKGNTGVPLTLVHFSDIHADRDALTRILAGADKIGASVDDVICTGDICGNAGGSIESWWDSKVLTCIGNHDSATYSGGIYNWTGVSMAQRDAWYIEPFENNWGIVHTAGTSYYYKDYSDAKVRLIVMDSMLYTGTPGAEASAQTAWLEGLLGETIDSTNDAYGYHVLIAIHSPHGGAVAEECSFSRYGQTAMPTYHDCDTPQTVVDAVASKITAGVKFIGYLCGHTHQDNIWDAEGDGKQLMYCITCAIVSQEAQWKNSDQYRGTDADAYNLVTIDTENNLIKIVRGGGANMDDHMRTRKAICFNYSTGQMVGEVL